MFKNFFYSSSLSFHSLAFNKTKRFLSLVALLLTAVSLIGQVQAAKTVPYADKCKGVVCKSNETCKGDGNCVWVGNPSTDNIPGYVCTTSNCPAPAFYCQSSNNCLDAKGYVGGRPVVNAPSTEPPSGTESWQSICTKSGGTPLLSGVCTFNTIVTCAGPGEAIGGNPCKSVGTGTSAGNCGDSNMIRCQCGNSWVGGSRDLGCYNLCAAAGLPCEPGKTCATSPKEPVGTTTETTTTTTTTPNVTVAVIPSILPPTVCQSILVFKNNKDITTNLSSIVLGDKVEYRAYAPLSSKIISMTFRVFQDGVLAGTYTRDAKLSGTSYVSIYEHTFSSTGNVRVQVTSLNK